MKSSSECGITEADLALTQTLVLTRRHWEGESWSGVFPLLTEEQRGSPEQRGSMGGASEHLGSSPGSSVS